MTWHCSKPGTCARPTGSGEPQRRRGPARRRRHDRGRRDGRDHGPVGLRQEHPHAHPRAAPRSPTSTTQPDPEPVHRRAGRDGSSSTVRGRGSARARSGFVFQSYNLVPTLTAPSRTSPSPRTYAGRGGVARRSSRRARRRSTSSAWPTEPGTVRRAVGWRAAARRDRARARQSAALVLGDEPTGNLDSARTAEVLALPPTLQSRARPDVPDRDP